MGGNVGRLVFVRRRGFVVAVAGPLLGAAVFSALSEPSRALPGACFILAVIVAGRASGWRGATVATVVSIPAFWYSVLVPRRTFAFSHWDQAATLLGFAAVGAAVIAAEVRRERTQRRLARADGRSHALQRLSSSLSSAQTPEQIADAAVDSLASAFVADVLAIGFVNDTADGLTWFAVHGQGASVPEPRAALSLSTPCTTTDALGTGRPVVENRDERQRRNPPPDGQLDARRGATFASWPLVAEHKPLGTIDLVWYDRHPVDAVEAAFYDTMAELCAQALLRVQIFADEHLVASALQTRILHEGSNVIAGATVTVRYLPATHPSGVVGGDWHDAVELPKNSLFVSVGDVTGHGVKAAADMLQLRIAGHTLAIDGRAPGEVLAGMNAVAETYGIFATTMVATFDPSDATLRFAIAGHPPPLLRRDGGVLEFLEAGRNPLLGLRRERPFREATTLLSPGDVVIVYTDGLIERRDRPIDDGFRLLAETVAVSEASHAALCTAILTTCLDRTPPPDDVCLLLLSPL